MCLFVLKSSMWSKLTPQLDFRCKRTGERHDRNSALRLKRNWEKSHVFVFLLTPSDDQVERQDFVRAPQQFQRQLLVKIELEGNSKMHIRWPVLVWLGLYGVYNVCWNYWLMCHWPYADDGDFSLTNVLNIEGLEFKTQLFQTAVTFIEQSNASPWFGEVGHKVKGHSGKCSLSET